MKAKKKRETYRHSREWYQTIGYWGYLVNLERNFFNDKELYVDWLKTIAKRRKVCNNA